MPQHALIQVKNLCRYYGNTTVVNQLEFELHKGEILGFLGPNGAGKSTTMNMLTGNLAPSAGQIKINGIDLLDHPKSAKSQIGYLPEHPPIYKDYTVNEYLNYCAKINRLKKSAIQPAIQQTLERCGLQQVCNRLIGNLSKGYQQRVGIAQAIIHSPEIVILDEPTVGLDPIQIREIRQLIRELGSQYGVLLSTHILPEVQMICDRVQIMNQGKLVFSDSLENLTKKMNSTAIIIRGKNLPKLSDIMSFNDVLECTKIDKFSYQIQHRSNSELAETIIERAVHEGWRLYELTPEQKTLEQVFIDITSGEQHHKDTQSSTIEAAQ